MVSKSSAMGLMNERQERQSSLNNFFSEKSLASEEKYLDDNEIPQYSDASSLLSREQLNADDERVLNPVSDRSKQSDNDSEQDVPSVDKSVLLDKAGELGLAYEELGNSVQDLSYRLSDLSNPSSNSTAWWQQILANVPYLGGLVEPDSGRMLLNLGEEGYALLSGDIQSLYSYMGLMSNYTASKAPFWRFPLLLGVEPGVVTEAEDIMVGSRSSDLSDFINAAKNGSVDINSVEQEAIPLLNWMALQAGEQSTDLGENEDESNSNMVFAAAISDRTIFANSLTDGQAGNLVDSIKSIYELVKTAPDPQQEDIEKKIDDELLNIIDEDNRWGLTDNNLGRMVDNIERLEREWQQQIELLLREEREAEETALGDESV